MDDKLQTLYEALKVNPNITGMPEDYNAFATYFQDPNKGKSLYEALKANPNIIGMPDTYESFGDKFGLNMEQPEQQEGAEEERIGFFEGRRKSRRMGLNSVGQMAMSIPQGINAVAELPANLIMGARLRNKVGEEVASGNISGEDAQNILDIDPKKLWITPDRVAGEALADSQLNNWFKDNQERLREEINRYDQTAWQYLKEGQVGKSLGAASYMVAESFYPTVTAAFVPGGAAALGLGVGSVAYDEVKDREDMTETQKVVDAVAQGTFEWLFEKLITKEMGNSLKEIFLAKGPEALKKAIASEGTKNLIGKAFKRHGVWLSPVAEGASEALTTIGQNAAAKYSGEDPERKLTDGVADSFIGGAGGGGSFSLMQKLGEMYANRQDEETEEVQATEQQAKLAEVEQIAKTEEENIRNEATGMAKEGTQEISFVTLNNDMAKTPEDKVKYVLKDENLEGKKEVVLYEVGQDGKLTGNKVMKLVSDLDVDTETGELAVLRVPVEQHIETQIQTLRNTAKTAMDEMAKTIAGIYEGDTFTKDGANYAVEQVTTDGVIAVQLDENGVVTGGSVMMSPDDVKQSMSQQTGTQTQETGTTQLAQQAPQGQVSTQEPIAQGTEQPITEQPLAEQQPQKAEFPRDKDGNIDYDSINDPTGYSAALQEEFGEDSVPIIDEYIKNTNEAIQRAGKGKDPIKKAREIRQLKEKLNFLSGVKNTIIPAQTQEQSPEQAKSTQQQPTPFASGENVPTIKTKTTSKGWQMGKADQERISREPQTFEEAVLQFMLGGGRISMNDYYTHFGNSQEERIKNIWMYAKDGQRLDVLNESSIFGQYPHLLAGLDGAMDMENAFIDVIKSHTGKNSIRERLDYLQSRPTEEGVPEEELERQRNEQDINDMEEMPYEVINNTDDNMVFRDIFESYLLDGIIDFGAIARDINNDPGKFTIFPWSISEEQLSELKNITEDVDRQRKIQERLEAGSGDQIGTQWYDSGTGTPEDAGGTRREGLPRMAENKATAAPEPSQGRTVTTNNTDNGSEQDQAGLDNGRTMARRAIDKMVGRPEEGDRIYSAIKAGNAGGSVSANVSVEEREELESRGINPYWDSIQFRENLYKAAEEVGVSLGDNYLDDKIQIHNKRKTGTSENDIYLNPDGKTVTKVNDLSYVKGLGHYHNLYAFIDRLSAHTDLFPNVAYSIKGFMRNKRGKTSIVIEQPYIKAASNATQQEIDEYLKAEGFKLSGERPWSNSHNVWSNGKYELFDARPANVLKGYNGELFFIDTFPHSVEYIEAIAPANETQSNNIKQDISGTPQQAQIDLLTAEKEVLRTKRNNLTEEFGRRNGLFGDTKADPNDLFGGLQALNPDAFNKQIQNINDRMGEIDRQVEVLYQNAVSAIKEIGGQREIVSLEEQIQSQNPNTEPTEGQKEAGNYKKAHINVQGMEIAVENPKGSVRSGIDEDGKAWEHTMTDSYGYFNRTNGKDGDQIDVFIGSNPDSKTVFVVDQNNPKTGQFDESKVMLGYDTPEEAKEAYMSNYDKDWKGFSAITPVSVEEFKKWLYDGARQRKPFGDYKETPEPVQESIEAGVENIPYAEKYNLTPSETAKKLADRKDRKWTNDDLTGLETNFNKKLKPTLHTIKVATDKTTIDRNKQWIVDNEYIINEVRDKLLLETQSDQAPLSDTDNIEEVKEEKIQDFGEKIGLARKDVAESGYKMTGKKQEQKQPAWKAKYKVLSQENMAVLVHTGVFKNRTPLDPNKFTLSIVNGRQFRDLKTNIDTKEEAELLIPIYEVALNHRVHASNANNEEFSIYRRWSSGKMYEIRKGFKTKEEAMKYMAENAEEIISWKSPKIERPHLDRIERKGVERRKGNATPEMFMETFGLRGGEFGNWVAADERQTMLNFAYDAMADMADILGVEPKALSLNGRLAIGFGSRGQGLSEAQAHFEAERGVINLTKINGAGALAHEWFHAFDSYFGMKDRNKFVPDEDGAIQAKIDENRDYLSGDYNSNPNIRKEAKEAWKKVWDAMRYKTKMSEYDDTVINRRIDSAMESIVSGLKDTRGYISRDRSYGLRKKAATPEQLARWDKLVERIKAHDFGEVVSLPTKKKYYLSVSAFDVQNKLDELYKEVTGRSKTDERMYYALRNIQLLDEELQKAKEGEKYESKVATTFYRDSKEIDKSRSSDYWSTNTEMSARAFESYVYDKMVEAGGQNDYLVHSVNNAVYQMIYDAKPYPEGEERTAINKAFDNLFDVLETKQGEDGNVVLYEDKIAYNLDNSPEISIFGENNPNEEVNDSKAPIQTQLNWGEDIPFKRNETFASDPSRSDIQRETGYSKDYDNSITYVERELADKGYLNFMGDPLTGPARIKSANDIAFLFKNLESASTENAFAVFIDKLGNYKVLYLSTGETTGTVIDLKLIITAAKEFDAKSIVMVHNHPSGNLIPSEADRQLHNKLSIAGDGIGVNIMPSIIINLDSGKYTEFEQYDITTSDNKEVKAPIKQQKVYQFDRQKLYVPSSEKTVIRSSMDVAKFLSKQKRGITGKLHVLILDRRNSINRIVLFDETISTKGLIKSILPDIGKYGESIIIASNGAKELDIRLLKEYLNTVSAELVDVIEVKQDEDIVNNYKSFGDNGLLEPKQEYRKTEVNEPQFQVVSPIGKGKYEKVKEHPNARIIDTIRGLLEKSGIEVITDKEKINDALKGTGRALNDKSGVVYGFVKDDKIYLDPDLMNPGTQLHEYTHLWDLALMRSDMRLWEKGVALMKQTPEWGKVVNDPNYSNIAKSDDLVASEVHARLTGKNGPVILNEILNGTTGDPVAKVEAISLIDKIKTWLKTVYTKLFGNKKADDKDLTLEQWNKMPIEDLVGGKRFAEINLEKSQKNDTFVTENEDNGDTNTEQPEKSEGTEVLREARLGSKPGGLQETRRILAELKSIERGEGEDSGRTESQDNGTAGSEGRKLRALAAAEVRAKESGAWISREQLPSIISKNTKRQFLKGKESEVYLGADGNSVIKLNNLSITPDVTSFLYRIEQHNKYFPSTTYEIIGFSENKSGEFCFVLKQPLIDNAEEATRQDIDDYFKKNGWYKILDGEYTDGEVEIWDVYPKNVLTDKDGNLYFIDVNVDPARDRYKKYKIPGDLQMEIRPTAKDFYKDGIFDSQKYLESIEKGELSTDVPVDVLQDAKDKAWKTIGDRGLPLKNLQEEVVSRGGVYDPKTMDAYMFENLTHGMVKNEMDRFDKGLRDNLTKAMAGLGLDYQEINDYLKSKHIPERNAYFEQKNGKEIAGGLSTEEANKRTQEYEAKIKAKLGDTEGQEAIDGLWDTIREVTGHTLNLWRKYGFLSKEGYNEIKSMYTNYVPLRGFAGTELDKLIEYQTAETGKTVNPMRTAKGRTSEADDPVQYMVNMAYSAMVMGAKNQIKQRVAGMVRANAQFKDLFRFDKVYEVWDGTYDKDGNMVYTETSERPAKEMFDNGYVKTKSNTGHKAGRTKTQAKAHEVQLYINGDKYVMVLPRDVAAFLNKDSGPLDRLNQALQYTKIPQFTRWLAKIPQFTRWLANNFTSKNPAFIPVNMVRDLQYSALSHFIQGGTTQSKTFIANMSKARKAIIQHQKNKGNIKDPVYSMYMDFMINGGETGYIHLQNVDEIAADMNKALKRLQGTNGMWDKTIHSEVLRNAGLLLENMAVRSENLSRFATYLTSKEAGKSNEQAAYDAKNISVNFNRKGEISTLLGGFYAFFNASVQGGSNIVSLAKSNPKAFYGLGATAVTLGFMNAMLASIWGDDDDDELVNRYNDGVSDFTKYNNLVILVPGTDNAVTIPLPHGFRWFHSLGVMAYQLYSGQLRGGKAIKESLSNAFSSISPVDPVGFIDEEGGLSIRPLVPTVAVPMFDINRNETYAGYPIHREPFTSAQEGKLANVSLGQKNVNKALQGFSNKIFWLGGGDPDTGSKMYRKEGKQSQPVPDVFDINPSNMEHVVEYYLGGRGKFWNNAYKTSASLAGSSIDVVRGDKTFRELIKDIDMNTMPVVRRLVQQPWDNVVLGMYYDEMEDIENYKSNIDMMVKSGAQIKYSPQYKQKIYALDIAQKKVGDINDRMKGIDDKSVLEELEQKKEQAMRGFLEKIKSIENENN